MLSGRRPKVGNRGRERDAEDETNLDGLSSLLLDPLSRDLPVLVQAEESSLSSSLDELIGLSDELLSENPVGKTLSRLDGRNESVGCGIPEVVRNRAEREQRAGLASEKREETKERSWGNIGRE